MKYIGRFYCWILDDWISKKDKCGQARIYQQQCLVCEKRAQLLKSRRPPLSPYVRSLMNPNRKD